MPLDISVTTRGYRLGIFRIGTWARDLYGERNQGHER